MAVIDTLGPFALPLLIMAIVVLVAIWKYRQHKALQAAHRQACLDHGLVPTDTPLGVDDDGLLRFDLIPRGDRRYSTAWGLQGSAELRLGGAPVAVQCAAFQWWWEDRRTETDSEGKTTTRYVRMTLLAGLVRLPSPYVMPSVRVEREGLLTRMGVGGRGDFQVESEEFNRRHDVRVSDRATAIRLFDAGFQQQMLGPRHDATFELTRD
ncbi:MAG TPA: hypothetical protein VK891_03435, partial [Euzebyales bacterium]|nr:hypothetical protein [Euzebyales bacterium]